MTDTRKALESARGQLVLLHSLANDTTDANWRDKRLYILQTCVRMSDALAAIDAALALSTAGDAGGEQALKPCPFCKGMAKPSGSMSYTHIHCEGCRAQGPSVWHGGPTDDRATLNRCEAEAIAAWNRRAPDPVLKAVMRCAEIADNHSFAMDIDWWLTATKKEVSAVSCRSVAAAIRREVGLPTSET